jgi:hypothetical protein
MWSIAGGPRGFEHVPRAVTAPAAAGRHTAVDLKVVEARATIAHMVFDVALGNALADANNH